MTVSETPTKPSKQAMVDQLTTDRQELLDLCRKLDAGEWDKPSQCEDWRVRDVVAHVAAGQTELWTYITSGGADKANKKVVDKHKSQSTAEILHQVEGVR